MFHKLTSLFIFFCCLYNYSFCDCFYIFDVGQGNCQLAVFEIKKENSKDEKTKIGIMYDCGSRSSKEHVKIHELKQNVSNADQDGYHYIFKKKLKVQSSKERSNKDESPSAEKGYSGNNYKEMSQASSSKGTKTDDRKKSIVDEIQKIVNELEYLFIIFSHPDEDHINLLNNKAKVKIILPKNLDVGVWYGGGGWDKTNVAIDVKTFFEEERPHTFELIDAGAKTCATIKERLPEGVFTKFTPKEREILENVHIACPHLESGNANSRSTVVKIKMKKLGMQFFLTGDAEDKTLESINTKNNEGFFKKDKDYISFVMLSHHGSKKNTSDKLFKLFEPDIIGISAGDGLYCHPEKELFIKKIKVPINNPEYEINFWRKFYQEEVSKLMITYLKTKENNDKTKENNKKKDAFIFDNKRNSNVIPLICTNQLGDIKIDEVGIKAKFSNIVEKGGIKYRVDFSKRVDVKNVNFLNPKPHTAGSIQEASDSEYKYYFCVPERKNGENKKRDIETESLYYHAIKLENDASTVADIKEQ